MKRDGTESCPLLTITLVINTGAQPMTTNIDTCDVCCVALELSKTSWVCAFAALGDGTAAVHKIKAGDVDRLMDILNGSKAKTERQLGRPLQTGTSNRRGRASPASTIALICAFILAYAAIRFYIYAVTKVARGWRARADGGGSSVPRS
jgi:hypothetical protein